MVGNPGGRNVEYPDFGGRNHGRKKNPDQSITGPVRYSRIPIYGSLTFVQHLITFFYPRTGLGEKRDADFAIPEESEPQLRRCLLFAKVEFAVLY